MSALGVPSPSRGGGIPASTEADPAVNRMRDRCKNITLPQTSFAGGKYKPRFENWVFLFLTSRGVDL